MDECRHGLVAAVCAVCCRAAEHSECGEHVEPTPVLAGAAVPTR